MEHPVPCVSDGLYMRQPVGNRIFASRCTGKMVPNARIPSGLLRLLALFSHCHHADGADAIFNGGWTGVLSRKKGQCEEFGPAFFISNWEDL